MNKEIITQADLQAKVLELVEGLAPGDMAAFEHRFTEKYPAGLIVVMNGQMYDVDPKHDVIKIIWKHKIEEDMKASGYKLPAKKAVVSFEEAAKIL